jgi:hypothetical protein
MLGACIAGLVPRRRDPGPTAPRARSARHSERSRPRPGRHREPSGSAASDASSRSPVSRCWRSSCRFPLEPATVRPGYRRGHPAHDWLRRGSEAHKLCCGDAHGLTSTAELNRADRSPVDHPVDRAQVDAEGGRHLPRREEHRQRVLMRSHLSHKETLWTGEVVPPLRIWYRFWYRPRPISAHLNEPKAQFHALPSLTSARGTDLQTGGCRFESYRPCARLRRSR